MDDSRLIIEVRRTGGGEGEREGGILPMKPCGATVYTFHTCTYQTSFPRDRPLGLPIVQVAKSGRSPPSYIAKTAETNCQGIVTFLSNFMYSRLHMTQSSTP